MHFLGAAWLDFALYTRNHPLLSSLKHLLDGQDNTLLPRDVHSLITKTCKYVTQWRGIKGADGFKIANLLFLQ